MKEQPMMKRLRQNQKRMLKRLRRKQESGTVRIISIGFGVVLAIATLVEMI